MQFYAFDRPSRAKIALRGSSSRPPTSEELLARAKKAREQRAHRRAQQNAATALQAVYRRRAAVHALADSFASDASPDSAETALVKLLLLSGVFNTSTHSISQNVNLVKQQVATRPFIPVFINRLVSALATDTHRHANLSQPMIVKAIVVLLSAVQNQLCNLTKPPSAPDLDSLARILSGALDLSKRLTSKSLSDQAKWGLHVHAAAVLRLLSEASAPHHLNNTVQSIAHITVALLDDPQVPQQLSLVLYRQFAISFLSVDNVLTLLPLDDHPHLVDRIVNAMASSEVPESYNDFAWDVANSYSALNTSDSATILSNVLEMADHFWTTKDNDALWCFIAVLSSLIQLLPMETVLAYEDDDDDEILDYSDDDNDLANVALRAVMRRLSRSLKRIVSEETVRNLFSAAAAEGQDALIRVCQLFNFLVRREKALNTAFQGALAFWRGSRSEGNSHILKTLWSHCRVVTDGKEVGPGKSSDSLTSLNEEATPILAVFASCFAYLLYIQDADEIFEARWPFEIEDVREIALIMKQYLFAAIYVRPVGRLQGGSLMQSAALLRSEPGLLDDVARLLSRLYACDSQRPFRTGEDFWLAGRGSLSSEAFLQDAMEAGPEVLVRSPEAASPGGSRQSLHSNSWQSSVAAAGELLRVAPYLVPFSSRAKIFQDWIARERNLANGGQPFFPTMGRTVSVRRKYVFEDAFQELNGLGQGLKATIRVKFIDEHGIEEAGIDGGGVFKEFMYEVLKLGFSPFSYALFKATPDGLLYPSPDAPVANENYVTHTAFLGRLLGKAVFDGVLVDIPLASFFLSKMLGQYNYPIDLGSLDPELYKNMKFLKNCPPGMVEDLGLNFTVANHAYGAAKEVELIRNGRNIPVTASNRIEYIHRVANYRMNTQLKEQSQAFLRGFSDVVPAQFIRLFSREEMQLLISGKTGKIDLEDLRRNTKYSGGYDEHTPVIKWFWQAMSELNPEQQSKMLQFVTSSPRAPLLGFSYLVPGFCIHRAEGEVRLPTASTCMNLLKLPQYRSLEVVREKLRYAIESNAGFDLS